MKKLLIINYHSLFHPGLKENQHFDPIYSIYLADFMEQMLILKDSGIPIINLDDIGTFNGDEAIAITFDDGHCSDYKIAFPMLSDCQIPASFFPNFVNVKPNSNRWKEYVEMAAHGYSIGSHGLRHIYLNDLTDEEQYIELKESKDRIENIIGKKVRVFSLPGGKMNDHTKDIARAAGYKKLLSTQFGLNDLTQSDFVLKRWNVTRTTSHQLFSKIVSLDASHYRWRAFKSSLFEIINRWVGNYHADRLNYYMREF